MCGGYLYPALRFASYEVNSIQSAIGAIVMVFTRSKFLSLYLEIVFIKICNPVNQLSLLLFLGQYYYPQLLLICHSSQQ